MTDLCLVLGTRPEIIKLSPIVRGCERRGIDYTLVHTGQHYSEELDAAFFRELDLPDPDYNIEVGSESHGAQTGRMLERIEEIILDERPDTVVIQGDTNSVLAGAIATSKLDASLAHVEAGLRSFDREMPEEINRIVTDHLGDYLFAPTNQARELLREEGIDEERIHVTGNTIVDAVVQNREIAAERSTVFEEFDLATEDFALVTVHRAENVDDERRLASIFDGIARVAADLQLPVVYPIHPRTRNRIHTFDIPVPDAVTLTEPLGFIDFLRLEDEAAIVLTDSGGVQEETCILGTPCVTMRDATERPETVKVGANVVVGTAPEDILAGARKMIDADGAWQNPFGDGTAAERILDVIEQENTDC